MDIPNSPVQVLINFSRQTSRLYPILNVLNIIPETVMKHQMVQSLHTYVLEILKDCAIPARVIRVDPWYCKRGLVDISVVMLWVLHHTVWVVPKDHREFIREYHHIQIGQKIQSGQTLVQDSVVNYNLVKMFNN